MKRIFVIGTTLLLCAALMSDFGWARVGGRGGGGGRAGGGGGRSAPKARTGGGGRSRPAPKARPGGAAKTPSMSRANAPSRPKPQARPSTGGNKPSVAGNRPNVSNKPGTGSSRPNVGNKPSVGSNRPNTGNKPSVGSSRPNAGNKPGTGSNRPGVANRPGSGNNSGLPGVATGGNRPGTGSGKPPSKDDLNNFLNLPGGSNKNTNVASRDRTNIGNKTNVGDRTKIGGGDNKLGNKVEVGDININAGNKVNVNRENNYNNIRNKYTDIDQRPFNRDQWRDQVRYDHDHWHYHDSWNRYDDNWFWKAAGWATVGAFTANVINNATPIRYDYGSTVVYRDNVVYVNDQQMGTPAEYYTQAEQIVESAPEVNEEQVEWMPLGVYAIAEESSASDSGMLLQLAVSKEGILAGTFYNETTDVSRPVEGMIDGNSQRAAWQFADGKNEEIVMEAGIYNLTEENSSALVHFGPDQTQTWLMVRLSDPAE